MTDSPNKFKFWEAASERFNPLQFKYDLLPSAESFKEYFNIPEIPDSFPNINPQNFVCETLLGELNGMRRKIDELIQGPMKLMNQIDRMYRSVLYDLDSFESSLGDLLKSVNPPNLNLTDLHNSFLNMYNSCPFISDSGILDGVLESFEDIAGLSEMTTPAFKNQLIDSALEQVKDQLFGFQNNAFSSTLDKFITDNVGSIADLQRKYVALLEASGVYDLLDQLYMLEQCLHSMCALGDRFVATADRYRSELGISNDPTKDSDFLNTERMKRQLGDGWDNVKHKVAPLKSRIKSIDSSIQKVKSKDFVSLDVGDFFA